MSQGFCSTASALLPGLDLDELFVLRRRRLRALAPRPAEILRQLVGLRRYLCLGAIGLDVGFWTHTNSISNERGITMATSLSIY